MKQRFLIALAISVFGWGACVMIPTTAAQDKTTGGGIIDKTEPAAPTFNFDPRPCEFDNSGICQPIWHEYSVDKIHISLDPPMTGMFWTRLMRGTGTSVRAIGNWESIQP